MSDQATKKADGASVQRGVSAFHRCLLCPTQIIRTETYCSPCGTEVWATRGNAEHGGEWAKKWDELWARIEKARDELQRSNESSSPGAEP